MLFIGLGRHRMFIGPCIIVIVEELKTNLMSLVVFISLIFAQHASNINMSNLQDGYDQASPAANPNTQQ